MFADESHPPLINSSASGTNLPSNFLNLPDAIIEDLGVTNHVEITVVLAPLLESSSLATFHHAKLIELRSYINHDKILNGTQRDLLTYILNATIDDEQIHYRQSFTPSPWPRKCDRKHCTCIFWCHRRRHPYQPSSWVQVIPPQCHCKICFFDSCIRLY